MNAVKHPTSGRNRYCGPAALSIIAGIDSKQAAALLRLVSGRRFIKSASYGAVLGALSRLGYLPKPWQFNRALKRPSFAAWCRDERRRPDCTYLVEAGHHYRVVSGRQVCCSVTQKPVFIGRSPLRRARVNAVWTITKVRDVAPETVIPQAPARPNKSSLRRKVKALMAELHASYDRDDIPDAYYLTTELVYCTNGEDPWYGDHYCYSLEEVHDRLAELKEMLETGRVHLPAEEPNAVAASPSPNEGGAS